VATRQRDRGAAAVEMAIVLPMLLLVIGGIVDFGRAFFTQVVITNAAREGARAAVVNANVQVRTQSAAYGAAIVTPVNVTYSSGNTDCSGGGSVTVSVTTQPFTWYLLGPALSLVGASGVLPSPLTTSATMECE
jgi:Flp pilus assembly protein TadG